MLPALIFVSMCLFMLYSALDYAGKLAFFGVIPLLAGRSAVLPVPALCCSVSHGEHGRMNRGISK